MEGMQKKDHRCLLELRLDHDHELESCISGSTGIGGAGVRSSARAFHGQDDWDFGRSRGGKKLRFGDGVWGREKLRWGVGVDAVAGVDATLQRALRWAELVGGIGSRRS